MSLLSYQLQIKRYQRELGLDDRTFNALDVKYNDINLLKQLQILNPVASNTGFYGTLEITNTTGTGGNPKYVQVKLAYNNVDITSYITISAGTTQTLTVPIQNRLPNPQSLLQWIVIFEVGVLSADAFEDIFGFINVSATNDPPEEENMCELLIDSGYINGGQLIQEITIATET